jgi:hypothetical protein
MPDSETTSKGKCFYCNLNPSKSTSKCRHLGQAHQVMLKLKHYLPAHVAKHFENQTTPNTDDRTAHHVCGVSCSPASIPLIRDLLLQSSSTWRQFYLKSVYNKEALQTAENFIEQCISEEQMHQRAIDWDAEQIEENLQEEKKEVQRRRLLLLSLAEERAESLGIEFSLRAEHVETYLTRAEVIRELLNFLNCELKPLRHDQYLEAMAGKDKTPPNPQLPQPPRHLRKRHLPSSRIQPHRREQESVHSV